MRVNAENRPSPYSFPPGVFGMPHSMCGASPSVSFRNANTSAFLVLFPPESPAFLLTLPAFGKVLVNTHMRVRMACAGPPRRVLTSASPEGAGRKLLGLLREHVEWMSNDEWRIARVAARPWCGVG